jgi:DNA-binding transcriptional MocR family regulator
MTDASISPPSIPVASSPTSSDACALIADVCVDRTSTGVAEAIGGLVRRGALAPGDRLPTVRTLARFLDVSSSTVAEAWRILGRHGLIDTARRNGTTVRAGRAEMSGRFWKVPASAGTAILDLSTGTPDTALLPSLDAMLRTLPTDITISSYMDRPVLADLEDLLLARWAFDAEALTIVDGALDAIDRLISATVSFGDVVVVEDPTFPPILDMLERAGARVIGVPVDAHGIRPDLLDHALLSEPAIAIIQPLAHNPTGVSMTPERVDEVADVFARHAQHTWVIEDHHAGDLVTRPGITLGTRLPGRVVRVHSYSKSHGPDLRIAAIGGAADPIAAVVDRRRLGPSWTSRLVQHILFTLLTDTAVDELVQRAADVYRSRRRALVDGLRANGIEVVDGEGLNVWIPVADEQRAVVALALHGIGVAPGAPFGVDVGDRSNHIRVSVGNARDDIADLVDALVAAAAPV